MSEIFGSAFALHQRALRLEGLRANVIGSNLANADTPNYKARGFDFKAALTQASNAQKPLALMRTASDQLPGTASTSPVSMKYRVPSAPSLDGNTVDTEMQKSAFASNTVHYMADLSFMTADLRMIKKAITG